jgi:two-component system, chemotaxis family, response regulator WspF
MRIAIVNDMPLAVEALRRALAFEPAHQVIWVAGDGLEAVRLCAELTPDLILMDLIMPVMDGVEATRQIMAETPCAIVIVTMDRQQNVSRVFEAMGHGALDVVDTPALGGRQSQGSGGAPVAQDPQYWLADRPAKRAGGCGPKPRVQRGSGKRQSWWRSALRRAARRRWKPCSRACPGNFGAAIVLVQHVDQVFAAGMAEWLSSAAGLPVRLAWEGEPPQPGVVLLAGTNHHIRLLKNGTLAYTAEPVNEIYRPSIDVFFESVASHWNGDAVGVLTDRHGA